MPGVVSAPCEPLPSGPGEFPLEVLPPVLREQARAIADVCRVPLDLVGPSVLATASACLGQGLEVSSAPGRRTAGNLFILCVKNSGAGGSVAYHHATAPLRGWQADALRVFEAETKPRLERERATAKADYDKALADRKTARKNGDDGGVREAEETLDRLQRELAAIEPQLVPPYVWVSDVTAERMAALMAARGETLAHFDADGADSVAGILGVRYGSGEHAADSLHLKAFSREPVAISRQGSGKGGATNVFLSSPCLAAFFVLTPDVFRKLLASERMMLGGLLPRCLVVQSIARPQPWAADAREIDPAARDRYERAAFALLANYRNREPGAGHLIELTGEAFDLFAASHAAFCEAFEPDFAAFDARHTEQAIRLALVWHAWRCLDFPPAGPAVPYAHGQPLDGDAARAGLRLMDWFKGHQAQILAPQKEAARAGKFEKVLALCQRRKAWIVGARDLIAAKICGDATEAERLLAGWETERRVVREPVEASTGGGRPRGVRWRVPQGHGPE